MTCYFLRLSMVRILPKAPDHVEKPPSNES
jgi:hypothetical protein